MGSGQVRPPTTKPGEFTEVRIILQFGAGSGHFQTGRYEEAAAWAAKSIGEYPKYEPAWRLAAAAA